MLVALIGRDKPGALEIRKANREAHLAYLGASDIVRQAGPLLDEAGAMTGSLLILDVVDLAQAQDWAASDPYSKAGLFETVQIVEWKRVIGG